MFTARRSADIASSESQGPRGTVDFHVGTSSDQQTFRSISAWVYAGCVWIFCAFCAVLAVLQEPFGLAVQILLTLATASLLTWVVLVRPYLSVTRNAVVVSNVLRTHVIPFGAVRQVRTRGLVEVTAEHRGRERTFRSWNAPGNTGRSPSRSEVYASTHPGMPRGGARIHTGALRASSGAAQLVIEERVDCAIEDHGSGTEKAVRSAWNVNVLLSALVAALVTTAVWWL